MNKLASIALAAASAISLVALAAGDALAQQKQKVSYKVAAGDSKYLQRHTVEADDEPGHLMSIYEIHRKFPADGPAINGVRIKESFTRGYGDYMSSNGLSTNYTTFVLENGDKFFTKGLTLGQADAAGKRSTISVNNITGATGKLAGMKGILRGRGASDGKAGYNETSSELEYWFEK